MGQLMREDGLLLRSVELLRQLLGKAHFPAPQSEGQRHGNPCANGQPDTSDDSSALSEALEQRNKGTVHEHSAIFQVAE